MHLIDRLPTYSVSPRSVSPRVTDPSKITAQEATEAQDDIASSSDANEQRVPAEEQARTDPDANASTAPGATHVLLGTRALPLRGKQIDLGGGYSLLSQGTFWTLHGDGALINGLPSTAQQPLVLGDTLSLGAAGHGRLIEVLD